MFQWAMNYFSDAEMIAFVWIMGNLVAYAFIAAYFGAVEFITWYRKSPEERATDWVNARIENDKKHF